WGNTLILAGTTAVVGGLIVIAVGVAARQLRHIADMLASRPLDIGHAGHGDHASDLPSVLTPGPRRPAAAARISFPPKPDMRREPAEPSDLSPVPPLIPPVADVRSASEATPAAADDRDHLFEAVRR